LVKRQVSLGDIGCSDLPNPDIQSNMSTKSEWPAALRLIWLTGGLVAISEPESNLVSIQTSVNGRRLAEFNIPAYGAVFSALQVRGFKIIGVTFVTGTDQFEGTRAPEFRIAGLAGGWHLWDTFQAWRNIVSGAAKANDKINYR
jgi:hypothetical protein